MDDTLEDVARVIGCEPANVADRVEEIMRENRDLLMDRHGLRAEGLKLAEENAALKAALQWYVENDDTREDGMFAVYNAASINNKRRAMRLLGLLGAT